MSRLRSRHIKKKDTIIHHILCVYAQNCTDLLWIAKSYILSWRCWIIRCRRRWLSTVVDDGRREARPLVKANFCAPSPLVTTPHCGTLSPFLSLLSCTCISRVPEKRGPGKETGRSGYTRSRTDRFARRNEYDDVSR